METDMRTYIIGTEITVVRRYRVLVRKGEAPWDAWKDEGRRVLIDKERIGERAMSAERIREDTND